MSWTRPLARVREHEVEEARKRLGAVLEVKAILDRERASLEAERIHEMRRAAEDPEALFALAAWRRSWERRCADLATRTRRLRTEEEGCRDALAEAFSELKKIERLAEIHAREARILEAQREAQALDEIALRRPRS